mgnify:CR=1 FL=1
MNDAPNQQFPKGVGQPAIRALMGAGYHTLDDLAGANEAELMKLHGVGAKALGVIREALAAKGLSFADVKK